MSPRMVNGFEGVADAAAAADAEEVVVVEVEEGVERFFFDGIVCVHNMVWVIGEGEVF